MHEKFKVLPMTPKMSMKRAVKITKQQNKVKNHIKLWRKGTPQITKLLFCDSLQGRKHVPHKAKEDIILLFF